MRQFDSIAIEYFKEEELLLWKIKDTGMPNFCLKGLQDFKEFSSWVTGYFSSSDRPLKYVVSASEHRGIYNMGGDLPFFLDCIDSANTAQLLTYAHLCIDAIFSIYTSFGLPAITLALVEGNAYGGGFECALAHDFIITEEQVQFCFPENKFNLFPGMGAHSLLTRKVDTIEVDRLIRSSRAYKARYLQSLGLVEKVTEKGKSMEVLNDFVYKISEQFNFEYHHIQCKKMINPLLKKELLEITNLWVKACMNIKSFDLRKMKILAETQYRKSRKLI